jgi:shikimate kinase
MILKLKRTPGIYLVGFMACGKSMIGSRLAERIGWGFADVDADIEAEQSASILEIFDIRGEEEFRKLETEALRRRVHTIQAGHPLVVALGGGAFTRSANYDLVEDNGVTVWLDCPLSLIRRRVESSAHRPLARDPIKFEVLYYARRESYARADYRVNVTNDDPESTVGSILKLPIF